MWRGDDHGLSDLRTIPSSYSLSKAWRAQASLSGQRRRALAKTGAPRVGTECKNAVCVAVVAESWLLNFQEFLKKTLILSRSFDDLK